MKTRIISGIVMGVIVAAILALGFLVEPVFITLAVALIAAGAVYELLHNAAGIKDKATWIGGCVYTALYILGFDDDIAEKLCSIFTATPNEKITFQNIYSIIFGSMTLVYFLYAVIMVLKNNKQFDLSKIVSVLGFPIIYTYAFLTLCLVIKHDSGLYYLLLLFNFSSVCDMGAYFVGVTIGRHKLCPNLSPKKTVEGAIGGIASSIAFTLIISLLFDKFSIAVLLLTIPFCVLGMLGDLFASAIKRAVGLKDYSNLIPGHGGILDRVDSIIMIAPFLYFVIVLGAV